MNPTMTEGQTIWQGRLLPRHGAIDASYRRAKGTKAQTGKFKNIIKRRKALKKKWPAATKGQATTTTTQKADPLHISSTQSCLNKSSQAIPDNVTKAKRTKDVRCQSHHQASVAQLQGVQKARNSKERQTHRLIRAALMTN